jgi:6-pyruvoyltetrahydropterin/6-carboxytetrahydropterin synthase
MFELMVKDEFASAHNLRDYKGKCEHLHGHNYLVEAYFKRRDLQANGLAVDFNVLKAALRAMTDQLDHKYLNEDVPFFKTNNTSAENLAVFIYEGLKNSVKDAEVSKVCVYESGRAMVCFYKD